MRNQRSNFIPLPTKPAKNTPKPLPKGLGTKKSSSSQTERVVLIKEENLTFYPCSRLGHNDGGMRRDYVKAINYINSCHKFMNTVIAKNSTTKNNFELPMVTNFMPLFPHLLNKKPSCKKEKKEPEEVKQIPEKKSNHSAASRKVEHRKSKSSFGFVKKEEAAVVDAVPVGDYEENVVQLNQQPDENQYTSEVANIVRAQIHQFLNTLKDDMNKAAKKKLEPPSQKCKNLDIVKQRLQELSKICCMQKDIESSTQIIQFAPLPQPPRPPPLKKDTSEDCSVIMSDTDCQEFRMKTTAAPREPPKITYASGSVSSILSESSDIRTDSEIEINITP